MHFPLGLTGVDLVIAIYIPDQADGDQWMFDLTGYIPVSVLRVPAARRNDSQDSILAFEPHSKAKYQVQTKSHIHTPRF